ncbi:unnamed protein product [Cyprideis torosa]|uniref:Uncharacterized protein n=1 Tax=Cyprideis torosa TaxID=163714 RepID=A0A7R8WF22_9CRUS|nr:unnamed protein product [Cyprideis torosa]CAG0896489.1 unnamed protein product [Cyprideis torosa]
MGRVLNALESSAIAEEKGCKCAFMEWRHLEAQVGDREVEKLNRLHSWRTEKMKTVSVALVLCLHPGVDPPDIVKTIPCARLECWFDPLSVISQRALEVIGGNLQQQYERWQPRARYRQIQDPSPEDLRRLCTSLRRNAKEERVLFHYNGHGVPKPTANGEIWVFNRNYTQYIPLTVRDLMSWMAAPSLYVFDCSNAGTIVNTFKAIVEQQGRSGSSSNLGGFANPNSTSPSAPDYGSCILWAACATNQILPMNPELPAGGKYNSKNLRLKSEIICISEKAPNKDLPLSDLFTSCLTTPIKILLRWWVLRNPDYLVTGITTEMVDNIPGSLSDRRSMLGELNWIFTAVTDSIAWNTLPRHLFQRLFRQDLLVASLFRNFLAAERIMRAYGCTPVSYPSLPLTHEHPMWASWDLAVDQCLSQLPCLVAPSPRNGVSLTPSAPPHPVPPALGSNGPGAQSINSSQRSNSSSSGATSPQAYNVPSSFFADELTAFSVWLQTGVKDETPPQQLPIVLQVLLSQAHRVRALELLSQFLDLGPWAVHLALSVGIFPYVLRLLQSSRAPELKPLLVFIWAKILAVDRKCQVDLVKEGYHKYFLAILSDSSVPTNQKRHAAFALMSIVKDHPPGKEAALQGHLITECLDHLRTPDKELRKWVVLCLGHLWQNCSQARGSAIRDNAHEKLSELLSDSSPEVRASAVFALGTLVNSMRSSRTEHDDCHDHLIAMTLIKRMSCEASPMVRLELLVALHWMVLIFETKCVTLCHQQSIQAGLLDSVEEEGSMSSTANPFHWPTMNGSAVGGIRRNPSREYLSGTVNSPMTPVGAASLRKTPSSTGTLQSYSFTSTVASPAGAIPYAGIYSAIWHCFLSMERDPFPSVSDAARDVVNLIRGKVREREMSESSSSSLVTTPSRTAQATPPPPSTSTVSAPCSPVPRRAVFLTGHPDDDATDNGAPSTPVTTTTTAPPHPPSITVSRHGTATPNSLPLMPRNGGTPTKFGNRKNSTSSPVPNHTSAPGTPNGSSSSTTLRILPLISSCFVDWCCKHYTQAYTSHPPAQYESFQNSSKESGLTVGPWKAGSVSPLPDVPSPAQVKPRPKDDPESGPGKMRNKRMSRNRLVREAATDEIRKFGSSGKLDDQVFINRNARLPAVLTFHPFEPHVAVADRNHISIWDWQAGSCLLSHKSHSEKRVRITSVEYLNAQDDGLLLVGTDDGAARVWKGLQDLTPATEALDFLDAPSHRCPRPSLDLDLVTAWSVAPEITPSTRGEWDGTTRGEGMRLPRDTSVEECIWWSTGSGLVMNWCQDTQQLCVSGDVRLIRVWDCNRETKLQDIPTGSEGYVTTLSRQSGDPLLVAGCSDGSVRLFDLRVPSNEARIMTWREHSSYVIGANLHRRWQTSGNVCIVSGSASVNHFISLYSIEGQEISHIRTHDGYMGQAIASVSCMNFHPYLLRLAAGFADTDSIISVYSWRDR